MVILELTDVEAAHLRESLKEAVIYEQDVHDMTFVIAAKKKANERIKAYNRIIDKLK